MKKRTIVVVVLMFGLVIYTPHADAATLSLTSGGAPPVTGTRAGTAASTDSAVGNTITATLNFGDVSLLNINSQVKIVVPIRISTTANYSVRVQATIIAGGSGVQATDIGFGVGNFRAQVPGSVRLTANAVSGITTSGAFGTDPSLAANDSDGQPQFLATLNNISTAGATQIFSGPATALFGLVGFNATSVLADLTFIIVPQFFTPTASFSVTLTITIV